MTKFNRELVNIEDVEEKAVKMAVKPSGEGRTLTDMQEGVLQIGSMLIEAGKNKQVVMNAADLGSDAKWSAGVTYSCNRVLQALGRITDEGIIAKATGKGVGRIKVTFVNYGKYNKGQYLKGADSFQGPNETLVINVGTWLIANTEADVDDVKERVKKAVEELPAEGVEELPAEGVEVRAEVDEE